MKIVQISDSHISINHPDRTTDLEVCIQRINELADAPDVVIHTGDIAHDGLEEEYRIAKEHLDKLTSPYYVLTGNRDSRQMLIETFADDKSISSDDRFVQYSIETYDTRLIVLDTLSEQSNKGQLCEERLTHFEKMLATDTERPILVFLHHTPFEVLPIPDPFQFENWNQVDQFQEVLTRHPSVSALYCGHVHRNVDSNIGNLPVSAITCMARDLRKGELTDEERNRPMFKEIMTA